MRRRLWRSGFHEGGVNEDVDAAPNDYQATLLHMFGLDSSELIFRHNGQEQTITAGRTARVVNEILA